MLFVFFLSLVFVERAQIDDTHRRYCLHTNAARDSRERSARLCVCFCVSARASANAVLRRRAGGCGGGVVVVVVVVKFKTNLSSSSLFSLCRRQFWKNDKVNRWVLAGGDEVKRET